MQKRFFLPLCVSVCQISIKGPTNGNKRTKNWHNTNRNNIKRTSSDIMTRRKKYIFLLKGNLCRCHTVYRYIGQQRGKKEDGKNRKIRNINNHKNEMKMTVIKLLRMIYYFITEFESENICKGKHPVRRERNACQNEKKVETGYKT